MYIVSHVHIEKEKKFSKKKIFFFLIYKKIFKKIGMNYPENIY